MDKFDWQIARVTKIGRETPRAKTFTLELPQWQPHLPGQHYDVRLTAEDGYQAQRSYSIASPPGQTGEIELTVDLIPEGEISSYLHENLAMGDPLEVRGPIGGYFVWGPESVQLPLLMIAGGSGVVPFRAMLRHRAAIGATNPTTLLYSARSPEEAIYRSELERCAEQPQPHGIDLRFTFTRHSPPDWTGYERRVDAAMLRDVLGRSDMPPQCFVCGPDAMVEQVGNMLVDLGVPPEVVRTERFGPG
jgi:ferredoxin-NADP reductase